MDIYSVFALIFAILPIFSFVWFLRGLKEVSFVSKVLLIFNYIILEETKQNSGSYGCHRNLYDLLVCCWRHILQLLLHYSWDASSLLFANCIFGL